MTEELAMTRDEYDLIVYEIWRFHRFGGLSLPSSKRKDPNYEERQKRSKWIKYIRPNWDMRDGMCFSVRFDGSCCGKDGKTFGSGYGETVPLYDQIMTWLNTPNDELQDEGDTA